MAATTASATTTMTARRLWFAFLNKSVSTADHAPHRFTGFRVMSECIVAHALLHLKAPPPICFINVNWHGAQSRQVPSSWQGVDRRKLKIATFRFNRQMKSMMSSDFHFAFKYPIAATNIERVKGRTAKTKTGYFTLWCRDDTLVMTNPVRGLQSHSGCHKNEVGRTNTRNSFSPTVVRIIRNMQPDHTFLPGQ